MEVHLLLLTCVTVISVSGQYLDTEYKLESVPLPIRRRLSNARYEIQPSVSQEIEYQDIEIAKNLNQDQRLIGNQQRSNMQNGELVERRPNNNGRLQTNGNQFSAQQREQVQEYKSSSQQNNRYIENQNDRNGGAENPVAYNNKLKTNLDNTNSQQNVQVHLSDSNVKINEYPIVETIYENDRPVRTNVNSNANYREDHEDNVRSTETGNNRQTARSYDSSKTNINNDNIINNNKNTETYNRRAIESNNYDNRQSIDTTRNNDRFDNTKYYNRNGDNRPNTKIKSDYDNKNYEFHLESTDTPWRNTVDDKIVTGGMKSTQDNELASRTPGNRTGVKNDEKRILTGNEMSTKTTAGPTQLPTVDDRAAFSGDKCPTGQVKFNNKCVYKD